MFARLETQHVPVYRLVPQALYEMFRAGRIGVPLLGLLTWWALRRRSFTPPLLVLTTAFTLHLGLTALLLSKWGYLQPRHTLVLVMLLTPLAAIGLAWLRSRGHAANHPGRWLGVLVLLLLPSLWYGLRVPNRQDGYLREVGLWLRAHDPDIGVKKLAGGRSPMRIAFYADCTWAPWYEDPDDVGALRGLLIEQRAAYLAIETTTDPHDSERSGNAALLDQLFADPLIQPHIRCVHEASASAEARLLLFALDWSAPARE